MKGNKNNPAWAGLFLYRGGELLQESDLAEESEREDRHESEEERHRRFLTLCLFLCDFGTVLTRGSAARSLHQGLIAFHLHRSVCFY